MSNVNGNLLFDGELEIVNITADLYDQTIELFQKYFMKYEVVSIATNLLGSTETINEMELLIREILKDGISFAARNRTTNELVAMAVNKIVCPEQNCSLDEVFSRFKTKEMKCVENYLERMECTYDIFKEWHIDCGMEIVFLSTCTNYSGRGLAALISTYSIEFAKKMKNSTLPADFDLPQHIRDLQPKAVFAVFTGTFSQRVGEKVGFETLNKVPYTEFTFDGKTFAEKINPIHTHAVFGALRL